MASTNMALHQALQSLYENSTSFPVSVDIIQKLAKHLRLETFVDTELAEPAGSVAKRLSIAGSLLLLEIDFSSDHAVAKVTLSSGHHNGHTPPDAATKETQLELVRSPDGPQTVKVHLNESELASFISSPGTDADQILLSSLAASTVGSFSCNLKYLANLDRMSPADGDLIVYLNTIATYLGCIHTFECGQLAQDEEAAEGLTTRFGKVLLNDRASQRVGVFLQFWKDQRLMADSSHYHKAVISVEESGSPARDLFKDINSEQWPISNSSSGFSTYFFTLAERFPSLAAALDSSKSWDWVLTLDTPVYLPQNLLDYLNITPFAVSEDPGLDRVFSAVLESGQAKCIVGEAKKVVRFVFEENSPFVLVRAVPLESMVQLSSLIPSLRNFIVFTSLFKSVVESPESTLSDCMTTELSAEASKKLKDTLKLNQDVPDNELVGLSTLGNDYMSVQMLNGGANLGDFIKSEESVDEVMEDEHSLETEPNDLVLTFKEIVYDSPNMDLVLALEGEISEGTQLSAQLKISNGRISSLESDVDMDSDPRVTRFVKALGICEDVLLAVQAVEN